MRSRLQAIKRDWDDLGSLDPFWAVLTYPETKHHGWDRDAFFDTGQRHVARLLARADELGVPARRERALDVGCGVGRTTRALAHSYSVVCGVDISNSLVSEARRLNSDVPNVSFQVTTGEDLRNFETGSFDLVHSVLVLQHLPSAALIERHIAEFVRVAAVGGLVVFQLPEHIPLLRQLQPRRRAYRVLRRLGARPQVLYGRLGLDPIQVRGLSRERVVGALLAEGAAVLAVEPDKSAGDFPSATYYATPTRGGGVAA